MSKEVYVVCKDWDDFDNFGEWLEKNWPHGYGGGEESTGELVYFVEIKSQQDEYKLWKGLNKAKAEGEIVRDPRMVRKVKFNEDYKAGDKVRIRDIKTKRNKTVTITRRHPTKDAWETTTGKIVYDQDIEESKLPTFSEFIAERTLTDPEKKKREDIVKGMKKSKGDLQKRYGDDWKSVAYATATKHAKMNEASTPQAKPTPALAKFIKAASKVKFSDRVRGPDIKKSLGNEAETNATWFGLADTPDGDRQAMKQIEKLASDHGLRYHKSKQGHTASIQVSG